MSWGPDLTLEILADISEASRTPSLAAVRSVRCGYALCGKPLAFDGRRRYCSAFCCERARVVAHLALCDRSARRSYMSRIHAAKFATRKVAQ